MIRPETLQEQAVAFLRSTNLKPEQVARFTNSNIHTVEDWIAGKQPMRGLRLNYLWWLMAAMGVATPELDEVPEFGRYLGELLAFDVIGMAVARAYCNTKQPQAVLEAIRGNREVAHPTKTYEELRVDHGADLQSKRAAKLKYVLPGGTTELPAATSSDSAVDVSTALVYPEGLARTRHLLEIAQALGGILPLANYLASDDCTPAERAMVRDLVGTDTVFALATVLNRLCSERAYTQGK